MKTKEKDLTFTIPHIVMKHTELSKEDDIKIIMTDEMILVSKTDKTAKDILSIVHTLQKTAANLIMQLAMACDTCDEDEECCLCNCLDDEDFEYIPSEIFNAFLDGGVCIHSLASLIKSGEIISELM